MKDPNHPPVNSIRGAQLAEAGLPSYPLNDPRPSYTVKGCNQRFNSAANDPTYKEPNGWA